MSTLSKPISSNRLGMLTMQLLCTAAALRLLGNIVKNRKESSRHRGGRRSASRGSSSSRKEDAIRLDAAFFRRLFPLLRLCIPNLISYEFGGVVLLTIMFYLRTHLTLLFARIVGRNGKLLVERNMKEFAFGVADIGLLAIPGTISMIGVQYVKMVTQQRLRDNLQRALHMEYLQGNNIYTIAKQPGLIDNPDHRITQETKKFCNGIVGLFRSLFKPLLDVFTLSMELSKRGGYAPPGFLISYYVLVATCMSLLLPNFAQLVATSEQKEGNLRTNHSQLVSHAEEIAFYGGEEVEQEHANKLLRSVIRHEYRIKDVKWASKIIDSLFIKYGSSLVGYFVCALVAYDQRNNMSVADLTQLYLQSVQLYIPLSSSIGSLLLLHKQIGALCSSVHRIGEFRERLQELTEANNQVCRDNVIYSAEPMVGFTEADICTPDGPCLLRDFSLTVTPGDHVLILGSNGSGKSALLRVLAGLWPLRKGTMTLPHERRDVVFLPQRVYLPPGTLRDIMTYPNVHLDGEGRPYSDDEIVSCAETLGLGNMVHREGGLDVIKEWDGVLSGGERQRVTLVRVLLAKPKFAFLDECTSAISQDDEVLLYTQLQKAGITLVTVSHRESLRSIHNHVLELDGEGGYRVSAC